ncbi:MAG: hypothetical protein KBT39_02750 [Bacteroidales bacterium]|nr:hypothetical protein [Bacteroidales bacterium]
MEKERTMTNKELKLPFQNAQEFVVWAREALARKKTITDKIQSDWDEYSKKRSNKLTGSQGQVPSTHTYYNLR